MTSYNMSFLSKKEKASSATVVTLGLFRASLFKVLNVWLSLPSSSITGSKSTKVIVLTDLYFKISRAKQPSPPPKIKILLFFGANPMVMCAIGS